MIITVNITKEQEEFLYQKRYNRSSLMRQAIEKLRANQFEYDSSETKKYKELNKKNKNESLSTTNEVREGTD